jgi:hypothetical protein
MLIKAYSVISKIEYYYALLRRAYNIIFAELDASIDKDMIL